MASAAQPQRVQQRGPHGCRLQRLAKGGGFGGPWSSGQGLAHAAGRRSAGRFLEQPSHRIEIGLGASVGPGRRAAESIQPVPPLREDHVGRRDGGVDDPRGMGNLQRPQHLHAEPLDLVRGERSLPEALLQGLALGMFQPTKRKSPSRSA